MKTKNIDLDTVIIGAGFAGIGMAIKLKENGHNSFLLLERSNEIGGTLPNSTISPLFKTIIFSRQRPLLIIL